VRSSVLFHRAIVEDTVNWTSAHFSAIQMGWL